jgi:hypothetical protein
MKKHYLIFLLVTNNFMGLAQITHLKINSESSDTLKIDQVNKVCWNENSNLETVFIALDEILKQKYTQEKLISVKHDSIKGEEFVSHRGSEELKDSTTDDSIPSDVLIPSVVNCEIGGLHFKYVFNQFTYSQTINNNEIFTIKTECAIRIYTKDSVSGDLNNPIDFISSESVVGGTVSDFVEQEFNVQASGKIVYQKHDKNIVVNNVQQTSAVLDTLIANLKRAGFDMVWIDGRLISLMYDGIGFSHE